MVKTIRAMESSENENTGDMASLALDELFYLQDLQQRKLYLNGEICEDTTQIIMRHIMQFNAEDMGLGAEHRHPIRLYINSAGGDLTPALALINIMEISTTPIYTYSMGETSSAGLFILIAGHKRFALKDTTAVLHKGTAMLSGTASQVYSTMDWYKGKVERMKTYVLENTCLDADIYERNQDKDWYLTIDELLQYGFVDEVVSSMSAILGESGDEI